MNKLEDQDDIIFDELDLDDTGLPIQPVDTDELLVVGESEAIVGKGFDDLTDDTLTTELMQEMMLLGLPKPPMVSSARWDAPLTHKNTHEHMVNLAAFGLNNKEIAERLGCTTTLVSKVLKKPEVKAMVTKRISELYGEDIKKAIRDRAMNAIVKMDEIVNSPDTKDQVRLQALTYILDHTVGKAQQTIEHKGAVLSELIVKADQLRDVTTNSLLLTKEKDSIDNLLEEVIPEDLVVGKRGDLDEKQGE
jgi:predicted transcriptional regulator